MSEKIPTCPKKDKQVITVAMNKTLVVSPRTELQIKPKLSQQPIAERYRQATVIILNLLAENDKNDKTLQSANKKKLNKLKNFKSHVKPKTI